MSILADHNLPFAGALLAMALLAIVQVFGLLDGFGDTDTGSAPEADADLHAGAGLGGALVALLGLGRVPLMIWLVLALFVFAALGVALQGLATAILGAALDRWLAVAAAGAGALPLTGALARPLARLLPRDETSAVGLDALVGRRAVISIGRAARGHPARARVLDRFGQAHHVMTEPHDAGSELIEGDEVLLVHREGETFFAVALAERRLGPVD